MAGRSRNTGAVGRCCPMPALARAALAAAVLLGGGAAAFAGHEVAFYPSYYPHEIQLIRLDPAEAAARLAGKQLHAYLGALPQGGADMPSHVRSVESLGAFLVLGFNPAAAAFSTREGRCAAGARVLAALRQGGPGFVFHPYSVTPYHDDFLHHLDRIERIEAAVAPPDPAAAGFRVRAAGPLATAIAGAHWTLATDDWDLSLEEVPVATLLAELGPRINGWLGPPWLKEGWFQAYGLLAPALSDPAARDAADSLRRRLQDGEYLDLAEQVNLERQLLSTLTGGCDRLVVGYSERREFYDYDDTAGVENIGYDSQTGLDVPVFVRTVKLKDYPWNGELHLAVAPGAEAAWNPVAGFTDPAGRLVWSIVADPALLPVPYSASWMPNRVDFSLERKPGQSGGFRVPAGAVLPRPGTAALDPVPEGTAASAKLEYQVTASPFLDGTQTTVADLLYALVQVYRWGERAGPDDRAFDPTVAAALAYIRDRLVGIRALRVKKTVNQIAPDVQAVIETPVLEVYLNDVAGDPPQVAALAPPWSTVPWHLLVLMEEAVLRGYAAFSEAEAARLGVPWLDLVRDPALQDRLRALIDEFEKIAYRPAALNGLVSADEARRRWRALRDFAKRDGHLLVTNGPYRLKAWTSGTLVFGAIRELTYPLGFGTFDRYVNPLHAIVREVNREAGGIAVRVEVENTVKIARHTEIRIEPLSHKTAHGTFGALVASRYLLIGPDGKVVRADKMHWQGDDRFVVELPQGMPAGGYTILVAVYLDGNSLKPSTGMLRFEVGA